MVSIFHVYPIIFWCFWTFAKSASLHFCSECNNLLYPKADQQRRIMVYACRICQYDEIGDNSCVYKNDLLTVTKWVARPIAFPVELKKPREQVGVTTDLGSDPTLVRFSIFWISTDPTSSRYQQAHSNIPCPRCGHEEYAASPSSVKGKPDFLCPVLYSIRINPNERRHEWFCSLSALSAITASWIQRYRQRAGLIWTTHDRPSMLYVY